LLLPREHFLMQIPHTIWTSHTCSLCLPPSLLLPREHFCGLGCGNSSTEIAVVIYLTPKKLGFNSNIIRGAWTIGLFKLIHLQIGGFPGLILPAQAWTVLFNYII
jgi:hypothetical protein